MPHLHFPTHVQDARVTMSDDELSTSLHSLSMESLGPSSPVGPSGSFIRRPSGSRPKQQQQPGGSPKSVRTSLSPNPKGGGKGGKGGGGREDKGGGGKGHAPKGSQGGSAQGLGASGSGGSAKRGGAGGGNPSSHRGSRAESEDWGRQQAHSKMVHLFSHLPQYHKRSTLSRTMNLTKPELHPAVVTLGLLYADGSVRGSNARTAAMLLAFKEVVRAYQLPPDKVLRLDLDKALKPHIQYLIDCRPHSIAMGNAIKWLRGQIHGMRAEASVAEAKEEIVAAIDSYVEEKITYSAQYVATHVIEKISDGDVILVYGRSYSVELALCMAKEKGKAFRVVVVDARPLLEGRRLLATLAKAGIPATYLNLNAVSYVMRSVSKVLLGAAAMLSNGAVISRAGTAAVAMMARRFNIPAIFCCETYKFSDKVQLDSICWNEVGDPAELLRRQGESATANGEASAAAPLPPWLKLLNIRYDLTPMKYVSLVVTEVGMIPPTSVPVLIRESAKDDINNVAFEF